MYVAWLQSKPSGIDFTKKASNRQDWWSREKISCIKI